ncbi:paired amphipathic helix protein Sin3a-like isoform X2 [Lycorma delicatula]|uniref:paired amphipathic helix protein Sin3a-like isoform X2 n=1 Tax=Lycorma delicatula TaxID=130591 RepID=UPI003F51A695
MICLSVLAMNNVRILMMLLDIFIIYLLKQSELPDTSLSDVETVTMPSQQQQQFKKLNVEDALAYLDSVKSKFVNDPEVYDNFLDTMKAFKSHLSVRNCTLNGGVCMQQYDEENNAPEFALKNQGKLIDTTGVVKRVADLFKEHPDLIFGFNTFLHPWCRIKILRNVEGYDVEVVPLNPQTSTTAVSENKSDHQRACVKEVIDDCDKSKREINSSELDGSPSKSWTDSSNSKACMHPKTHLKSTTKSHVVNQNHGFDFSDAVNYVNKIKVRFQSQPDKYEKFLDLLQKFQHQQKHFKKSEAKHLAESDLYLEIIKLFENQDDLINEFIKVLPAAFNCNKTNNIISNPVTSSRSLAELKSDDNCTSNITDDPDSKETCQQSHHCCHSSHNYVNGDLKRAHGSVERNFKYSSCRNHLPCAATKKGRKDKMSLKSNSFIADFGTLKEYAFFDKVYRALGNEEVYENFLRCIVLFNEEIVTKEELVLLIAPFLTPFPELFAFFKKMLGISDHTCNSEAVGVAAPKSNEKCKCGITNENINSRLQLPIGDCIFHDIDYSTCKRVGVSYCELPENCYRLHCFGRTPLCQEVLNDKFVLCPNKSEDTTFNTAKKAQYEQFMYRVEDERFELDIVIEANAATIRVLEGIQKRLRRLRPNEAATYRLDNCLGGQSPTIHQRALWRIYGDMAPDIIEGLKRNPVVAVPVILKRLKSKEQEWREAQKGFNKIWREQTEKAYLKSLDRRGVNQNALKQDDVREEVASKTILSETDNHSDKFEKSSKSCCVSQFECSQNLPIHPYIRKSKLTNKGCDIDDNNSAKCSKTVKNEKTYVTNLSDVIEDTCENRNVIVKKNNEIGNGVSNGVKRKRGGGSGDYDDHCNNYMKK